MARPTNANAQTTQKNILHCACQLFSSKGHGSTSIRAIASQSGVSLATVHHYFGSKDELYSACISAMHKELAELESMLKSRFASLSSQVAYTDLLYQVIDASYTFACGHRDALRLVMRNFLDRGSLDPHRRDRVHIPFLIHTGALLSNISQRILNPPQLVVQSLMHLIVRYALTDTEELAALAGLNPIEASPESIHMFMVDHLAEIAMRMLGLTKNIEYQTTL